MLLKGTVACLVPSSITLDQDYTSTEMAGHMQTKTDNVKKKKKSVTISAYVYLCNTRRSSARGHNVLSIMQRFFIDSSCAPDHFSINFFRCSSTTDTY